MATITYNKMGPGEGMRPEVTPISVTHAELVAIRDAGNLIPGQFYLITDYVTTVNEPLNPNARSAGHPFDILVRADSTTVLNEQAWAVKHDGDTYFDNARLEAWELKYQLDNVQWSQIQGTFVTDEDNGYTFQVIGDITLSGRTYKLLQGFGMYVEDFNDYALMETVAEGEQIISYSGVPEEFDPEEPDVVGTASGIGEVTEPGKGTITWMKDEHGNECHYDFKNIQYKRWKATDSVSGRTGLGGMYMVADIAMTPQGLSVEDAEDFIWAYTFSSDENGGEQTDHSLTNEHQVHSNTIKPYDGGLPNNVMFGVLTYENKFEVNCSNNSLGSKSHGYSFGSQCQNNSHGLNSNNNKIGSNASGNSVGSGAYNNNVSFGSYYNSISNGFQCNSIGSSFRLNSIGSYFQSSTVGEYVNNTNIGSDIRYVHVLNGVTGTSSSKLTLAFAAKKNYCQMAAINTAGELKIWVPADLV